MSRYAIFGSKDPNVPVVAAYLGGRPVVFAQLDPASRRPGEPVDMMVPLTTSRFQHAMDIERGYDPHGWEPTPLVGLGHTPKADGRWRYDGPVVDAFGAPALQDVVNCCPWRLKQPRWLTPYEWTVVEQVIESSIATTKGLGPQTRPMARTLTMAISTQNQAPAWKQSAFGPAPAVAAYQYGCLGAWWGSLDYASQMRAVADIHATDLLRRQSPPWSHCPRSPYDKDWKPDTQTEYQIQKGAYGMPGVVVDPCAYWRLRTAYLPLTGNEMIDIMKTVGGGIIDPQLQQMINVGGAVFADRTFIIGYEFRPQPDYNKMPASMNTLADLLKVIDAMVAEVALIWAPGKGMSIRNMAVTGKIDAAQLQQLLTALAPEALNEWWKQIPNLLPGLAPLLGGSQPMHVTDRLNVQRSFADPSTPPTTGLKVVDEVGDAQDDTPPTEPPTDAPAVVGEGMDDVGLYIGIAVVLLGGALIWRGYSTR